MREGEEKNSLFFFALFFCLGFRVFGQKQCEEDISRRALCPPLVLCFVVYIETLHIYSRFGLESALSFRVLKKRDVYSVFITHQGGVGKKGEIFGTTKAVMKPNENRYL